MCNHTNTKDGYCTSCGLQIKDMTDLHHTTPEYKPMGTINYKNQSSQNQSNINSNYISSYTNNKIKNEILLDKLITDLNIFNYKHQIKNELKFKKFKSRLSSLNKYLLVIYKILREDSFPILFSDLLKYSINIKKYWFKEYKFIPYTETYVRNVLDRLVCEKENSNEDLYGDCERSGEDLNGKNKFEKIFNKSNSIKKTVNEENLIEKAVNENETIKKIINANINNNDKITNENNNSENQIHNKIIKENPNSRNLNTKNIKFLYNDKELKIILNKLCSYEIEKVIIGWLHVKGFIFEQEIIKGINLERLIKKIRFIIDNMLIT